MIAKKSSKELLRESAIELFSRNPVDRVTVNMLCENCGISQRTFYNHFRDKYDLISWVYTSVNEDLIARLGPEFTLHSSLAALVGDIIENSSFYANIIRYTGQNSFRLSVYQPLRDTMRRIIEDIHGDKITPEMSDAINFYIFGCMGYMEDCLLRGDIVPADITLRIFEQNIPSLLAGYL